VSHDGSRRTCIVTRARAEITDLHPFM
jgi:predicted RNA-binding protein YlxR (DUF448 family)